MTDTAEIVVKPRPRASEVVHFREGGKAAVTLSEHIVEIVSDSGEGAQRCGQTFGAIASQMGNGVWTVEIIPAEIRPPARSVAGGSGNRVRLGSRRVTNGGNETDLVIAFNEQVLLGRVRTGELKPGCKILLESMWREAKDSKIVESYTETYEHLVTAGYDRELVDGAVERLVDLGILDDESFARAWVESRDRAHPRGERALARELFLKGIDRTIVETVLAEREAGPDHHPLEGTEGIASADERAAERLLARRASSLDRIADPRRRRQRAYLLLVRSGFDSGTAASAAERVLRTEDDDRA